MTIINFPQKSSSCCSAAETQPWIDLPVCPKANSRIKFTLEQETGRAIPAEGALTWLKENTEQGASINALEIAGPGDPLATPELTLDLVSQICRDYPKTQVQIATLGLHAAEYAKELANAGVTRATLLIDAATPEIAQNIYAWIRPDKKTVPLKQAAEILISEQKLAITAFTEAGIDVAIRSTVYQGHNDEHIELIAKSAATLGVKNLTLVPFKPASEKGDNSPCQADKQVMDKILKQASAHVPNVTIYKKEPANIGMECTSLAGQCVSQASMLPKPSAERPNIAIVSSNGMEIDLHLGQAYQVLIYGPREDGLPCFLETRPAPEPGSGGSRWQELAESLTDCFALLCASAGDTPRKTLGQQGITVLINDGEIEGTADVLFGGNKKCKKK